LSENVCLLCFELLDVLLGKKGSMDLQMNSDVTLLTSIASTRSQNDTCLPFSLYLRHGFRCVSENVDTISVNSNMCSDFYVVVKMSHK